MPLEKLKLLSLILLLAGLLGYTSGTLTAVAAQEGQGEGPQIGAPAPDFTLKDLKGQDVSLSNFRGKAVLLNFWTTWCPPCRGEVPALQDFYETYGDRVQVLGIDIMERRADVARFANQNKITYPILLDSQGKVAAEYKIKFIPTSFFVDDEGVIREIISGPLNIERLAYTFARKAFRSDLIPLGIPGQVITSLDPNEDGNPEAALLDVNGDGKPDGGAIDVDSDGHSEATAVVFRKVARGSAPLNTVKIKYSVDLATGGLIIQRLQVDLNDNDNPEIKLEDTDFDGIPDRIALDFNDDGVADLQFP